MDEEKKAAATPSARNKLKHAKLARSTSKVLDSFFSAVGEHQQQSALKQLTQKHFELSK